MTKSKAVLLRFLKGFVAGGLAQVAVFLSTGLTINNTDELTKFAFGLLTAFIIGGILATEKALSWRDEI